MKRLMLGNEAIARGLYEASVRFVSSYPGTPSTEITEYAAEYPEIYAEWAPNEKVAMEAAFGAALAGGRAFSAMKHVGLNVGADLLFTTSYTGINGGLVIAVADDMGMHSSQNEQDSRHYARAAKVPMLEPSDSQECIDYIKLAYEISESFDTPVLVRSSTRIAHSQSVCTTSDRMEIPLKDYVKDVKKYVMIPANARGRRVVVEEKMAALTTYAGTTPINQMEMNSKSIGVITSGIAYQYAKEALGDQVSYLKLGLVNPISEELIRKFADSVDTLYVIEELEPFIEDQIKAMGIPVLGKELFSIIGEYSAVDISNKIFGTPLPTLLSSDVSAPPRPPVMCAGCPHRGVYYTLNKMKLTVLGDIGCYSLGALPPLNAMETCICMGAAVSSLHGFTTVRPESLGKTVGIIGDSTFLHSGITGLIDIVYNMGKSTLIIVDNHITGMTGHQENPSTGRTLKGEPASIVSFEDLCKSLGVTDVHMVDSYDLPGLKKSLEDALSFDGPSVIIARRPCALLKNVKHSAPHFVDHDTCTGCGLCLKCGCPSISVTSKLMSIDDSLCAGCGLCSMICPFGAIKGGEEA